MFKKGDFVKVRSNTELVSGEIVNDWAGEITEVYRGEKTALVTLDATTINSLDDAYLEACIEEGAEPFEYIFGYEELEKSIRRDTDTEQMAALDGLASRMIKLEGDEEAIYFEQSDKWIKAFTQSNQYSGVNGDRAGQFRFCLGDFYGLYVQLPRHNTP